MLFFSQEVCNDTSSKDFDIFGREKTYAQVTIVSGMKSNASFVKVMKYNFRIVIIIKINLITFYTPIFLFL